MPSPSSPVVLRSHDPEVPGLFQMLYLQFILLHGRKQARAERNRSAEGRGESERAGRRKPQPAQDGRAGRVAWRGGLSLGEFGQDGM